MNDRIREKFNTTYPFAFAIAPSNTKLFVKDIESSIITSLSKGINISNCFSKINGFDAGKTNEILSNDQLKKSIELNKECFNELVSLDIINILLLDDVYALGNTFNAMKLLINETDSTKNIITATILKTT